jgi:hypothetical protein
LYQRLSRVLVDVEDHEVLERGGGL